MDDGGISTREEYEKLYNKMSVAELQRISGVPPHIVRLYPCWRTTFVLYVSPSL
jgi:hypothetical protein